MIRSGRGFQELVDCSGVIVIDFPSTTLLQAIATKKPVFVLTKHLPLAAEAGRLLGKRAYCSDRRDEFLSLLERFLFEGPEPRGPDPLNREFLERYGIYRDDGKVLERVFQVLSDLPRVKKSW